MKRSPGPTAIIAVIHYYSGVSVHREASEWSDGHGFDLLIGPVGAEPRSIVRWRTEPTHGGAACRLTITSDPIGAALQSPPEELRQRVVVMTDYLQKTMKGFRHRVETGEAVVRNQFGPNPMASPEVPGGDS